MEKTCCAACGMPLEDNALIGLEAENNTFCIYCVDENKTVRPCRDIFNGGVQFFMQHVGLDRGLAEKITRKNMHMLHYWHNKPDSCLCGESASDEEFADILAKLRG